MATPKKYQVPALKRAFAVIDSLHESSFGLTVQEVSRIHKIPYSTAFYLLETMQECGYVQRNDETKKYVLGYKLFAFRDSSAARNTLDLRALAQPLLQELTDISALTVHLAILHRDEAVYIEKTEPAGFIRLNTWVGKRNSLHCSAVGKALLMHLQGDEIRKICKPENLVKRTNRTITTLELLLADLEKAAVRGYAMDDGEDEEEGRCIGAPIFGGDGKVIAAISLSGTLNQIDGQRLDALGKLVRNYAERISQRLGYRAEPARNLELIAR